MKKTLFILCTLNIILFSCNKTKLATVTPVVVFKEEDPLDGFLKQTGLDQLSQVYTTNNSPWQFATLIEPLVEGDLISFNLRVPKQGIFRFLVWDSNKIIFSETVGYTKDNTFQSFPIKALKLQKGKNYYVSFATSQQGYQREKFNKAEINYPVTVGNIKIILNTGGPLTDINLAQYPAGIYKDRYYGDFSFKFIQTK
jgi:hypothetical protein